MGDGVALEALLCSDNPGTWPEETTWAVFRRILDQESPLPGVGAALARYGEVFASVYAKIAEEHTHCSARYYRQADGTPLVNPLNLEHFTRMLHVFSRRLYLEKAPETLLDCLFFVMRGRCGFNLFYRTQEIDQFFPLHALGSVVGYGEFGPFIAISQNCTIGHNHGHYPTIEGGLWMGPGSSILGKSKVGRNVRVAANALVVDRHVPDDVVVFGIGTAIKFKDNHRDNRSIIFDRGLDRYVKPAQS
ncbi:putative Transferase hexapeptide repeat containing protein [Candidatus Terasakiella magnetica]|nr:putative Transferase hexapeptide repeat containing protein [Candidatus Terasakiella magnetica]